MTDGKVRVLSAETAALMQNSVPVVRTFQRTHWRALETMNDKEVKHLSKVQLIEILYMLSQENDSLREENAKLKARLDAIVDRLVGERAGSEPAATAETVSSGSEKK